MNYKYDINIIGGLGHVGLPLGIILAQKGFSVCLYDINEKNAKLVNEGKMPFVEYGAEPILQKVIKNGSLSISLDKKSISMAKNIIVALGTPIDKYLNPKAREFIHMIKGLKEYLVEDQLMIVRSTVFPKTCERIYNLFKEKNFNLKIAYCPERIIQGYSVQELGTLPQIVSGITPLAQDEATKLFEVISPKIISIPIREAELVKLFCNAWRYIQFATTNQFYMMATDFGVEYANLRRAMKEGYGRAANLPSAGFAAGPCLLKDTMQLFAFTNNQFLIGQAAMNINEGLPNYIVQNLRKKYDLSSKKVGILGMTFKSNIDDIRDALSYKISKILHFYGAQVYCSDEFKKDPEFCTKEELVETCDIIILGVPHDAYKTLKIPEHVNFVDIWEFYK